METAVFKELIISDILFFLFNGEGSQLDSLLSPLNFNGKLLH